MQSNSCFLRLVGEDSLEVVERQSNLVIGYIDCPDEFAVGDRFMAYGLYFEEASVKCYRFLGHYDTLHLAVDDVQWAWSMTILTVE
jgi:hypothetical protein